MTETFAGESRIFYFINQPSACQKGDLRQPKDFNLPVRKTTEGFYSL